MSRVTGLTLALVLAASTFAASPAFAHAHLRTASPAEGATVAAPAEIVLGFTEALEVKLSSITVRDAQGHEVQLAPAEAVAGDGKALKIRLKATAPGPYTVEWAAISVDTHRVTGRYQFTVRP
ncbi:copper homeostasis periplasmic binding protein CopC [Bosea sp. 2RAB26]|uniref:copper homeostasis periplasmic binding protein CopC n=1 Tax=Bosea sp. 2RAB26 TaxID=3237476 RepID=UPI003F8EFE4F